MKSGDGCLPSSNKCSVSNSYVAEYLDIERSKTNRKRGRCKKPKPPRFDKPYQLMRCPRCKVIFYAATKPFVKCPNRHTVRLNEKNSLQGLNVRPIVRHRHHRRSQVEGEMDGLISAYDLYRGGCTPKMALAHRPHVQTCFSKGRRGLLWKPKPNLGRDFSRARSRRAKKTCLQHYIGRLNVYRGSSLPRKSIHGLVEALLAGGGLSFWNHLKRFSCSGWPDLRDFLISKEGFGLLDEVRVPSAYSVPNHCFYLRGLSPWVVDNDLLPRLQRFQEAWERFSWKFSHWQRWVVEDRLGGVRMGRYLGFSLGNVVALCRFVARSEALRLKAVYDAARECRGRSRGRRLVPIIFCRLATRDVKRIARRLGVMVVESPQRKRFLPRERLEAELKGSGLRLRDALKWFMISLDGEGFLRHVSRVLNDLLMVVAGENRIEGSILAAMNRRCMHDRVDGEENPRSAGQSNGDG